MTDRPQEVKRTLFLIDGSSYIYRAYHAIRGLATRDGFPTNAVFGFVNMLLKVLKDHRPDYVAIVLDSKGPTFRHERYPQYKANRPPMPDDLTVQIPRIEEVMDAFRIPVLRMDGVEADDIIATLVDRFAGQVDSTVIISSDKDLMQLVSPRVVMLDTMKDIRVDEKRVRERFGVSPEQVPDVLALMGDSSDNVPGLTGAGPKTAGKLISRYGGLEEVLAHSEEVGGKLGQNLQTEADRVRMALSLVTLVRDVGLETGLEDLRTQDPDDDVLRRIFGELEFTRLIKDLVPHSVLGREGYGLVLDDGGLVQVASDLRRSGRFALDVETDNRDPMRANLVGISFSWEPGKAAYIPVGHHYLGAPAQLPVQRVREVLDPVLSDPDMRIIGQNIKYDLKVLLGAGWNIATIDCDTMLASYLANPSRRSHSLAEIASEVLNHTMITYDDVTRKGRKRILFSEVPLDIASDYSCEDADVTLRVADHLTEEVEKLGMIDLLKDVELPLIRVLADMEMAGVCLDKDLLDDLSGILRSQLSDLEVKIHREAGRSFNINSPRQLAEVLFGDLGLPPVKKTKTGYSTSGDVLLELSSRHHLPGMILDYRSLSKLKSTYVDALPSLLNPKTGRIHTSFNQAATATGRLSSSDPNLQNIPVRTEMGRRIRGAFIAPQGSVLLSADYSQIELRVLAHLSEDSNLLEAFNAQEDIHTRTARQVLGAAGDPVDPELRRRAKVVNFGIIYGMSAFGLSKELGIAPKEAAGIIDGYFDTYTGVKDYIDRNLEEAREKGYVTTLLNRRRYLPELTSSNPNLRQLGERMAVNTPIQGTAADLIKVAMLGLHDALPGKVPGARMIIQVHDELLFEVPEGEVTQAAAIIRAEMEGVAGLRVPLTVDVGWGSNWAEAH